MSEATGEILFHIDLELTQEFGKSLEVVHAPLLEKLFLSFGIQIEEQFHPSAEWYLESIETRGGFLILRVFGDEWVPVLTKIVSEAIQGEVYGCLWHEYGQKYFYSYGTRGSFLQKIDYEHNFDSDREPDIIEAWRETCPPEYLTEFESVFDVYNFEKDEDDSDDSSQAWSPQDNEDFYEEVNGEKLVSTELFWPEIYQKRFLEEAARRGAVAQSSKPLSGELYPFSILAWLLSSDEHTDTFKVMAAEDILHIFEVGLHVKYRGHSGKAGYIKDFCEEYGVVGLLDGM